MPSIQYDNLICFCTMCGVLFPETIEEKRELDAQQTYSCPECGRQIKPEQEGSWMKGTCASMHTERSAEAIEKMRIAGAKGPHPGPTTERGKFIVSMNALKTGAHAKRHLFPRADAGNLDECAACPCGPNGDNRCKSERWDICAHAVSMYGEILNAHFSQDPKAMRDLIARNHVQLFYIFNQCARQIMNDGPIITNKTFKRFGRGENETEVEQEDTITNPAFKGLEVVGRLLGGLDLREWQLTPASQKRQENADNLQAALDTLFNRPAPERLMEPVTADDDAS